MNSKNKKDLLWYSGMGFALFSVFCNYTQHWSVWLVSLIPMFACFGVWFYLDIKK